MNIQRDRVISISLTEKEWQDFIARQPKPVDWIRARILDELAAERRDHTAQTSFSLKT